MANLDLDLVFRFHSSESIQTMGYRLKLFLVLLVHFHFCVSEYNSAPYVLLAQRRMENDINFAEIQIEFVKNRYSDLVGIIQDTQDMVQLEIYQVNERLTLMKVVNSTYRYCIDKYKPGMYTKFQAQEKFDECFSAAQGSISKLMQDTESPMSFAKNTANVLLPMDVQYCQEFSSNETLQEDCVIDKVIVQTETFDETLNKVQDNLEVNLGISSLAASHTMQCSFEVQRQILIKMGSSLQLIDICLANMQLPIISAIMYK